jgi:hypothetical protein
MALIGAALQAHQVVAQQNWVRLKTEVNHDIADLKQMVTLSDQLKTTTDPQARKALVANVNTIYERDRAFDAQTDNASFAAVQDWQRKYKQFW